MTFISDMHWNEHKFLVGVTKPWNPISGTSNVMSCLEHDADTQHPMWHTVVQHDAEYCSDVMTTQHTVVEYSNVTFMHCFSRHDIQS